MPWYDGPTLVEMLELATVRSSQTVGFRLPVQRVSRPGESFRGYQGTVAGGSVKPGDCVVILPSGMVANVTKIVTFDLVRNAAVAGDADHAGARPPGRRVARRHDRLDRQPAADGPCLRRAARRAAAGRHPARQALLAEERHRAASASQVQPSSQLDLKTRQVERHADALSMNAIGKVHLAFDEQAVFDTYEQNRTTGAFILIDPDTNNTVAGGMITAKRSRARRHPQRRRPRHPVAAGRSRRPADGNRTLRQPPRGSRNPPRHRRQGQRSVRRHRRLTSAASDMPTKKGRSF